METTQMSPGENLASLSPRYAALLAKAAELSSRKEAIRTQTRALWEAGTSVASGAGPKLTPAQEAGRSLLGDLMPVPAGASPADDNLAGIADLRTEEAAVDAALLMLRDPLRDAKREVSRLAWEREEPAFRQVLDTWCDAITAFAAATDALANAGLRLHALETQPPFPLPAINLFAKTLSWRHAKGLLNDAAAAGMIDPARVPPSLA